MAIICKQCGYENPDGAAICEICAEELTGNVPAADVPVHMIPQAPAQTAAESMSVSAPQPQNAVAADGREYYVMCPESQTKTVLENAQADSFFCAGCKKQHEIDGFLWVIESREKEQAPGTAAAQVKGDSLYLEELNSHIRIDIDKEGGTLGRYGKYGAEFFRSRGLLKVSGEHCRISYQYGDWILKHISRTNLTIYNNMVLEANAPTILADGKILTLATAVSFVVRIGT